MSNKDDKNIQVFPVKEFKITIDYLSHEAFYISLDPEESKEGVIVESRDKGVTSKYIIINVTSCGITLTEFDRTVLNAAISEQLAGNEFTTPEIIYHLLGGGHVLYPEMRKNILDSFERLSHVRIVVEMADAKKKLRYNIGDDKTTYKGYLMPTESVDSKINGQHVSAIHFLKKGIIFTMSDIRNQMLTCSPMLLNAPIRHSECGISLNHYLLRRTLSIKGSHDAHKSNPRVKPLRSVITFDDMFEKCGLNDLNRKQRAGIKKLVETILNFFVKQQLIKSFEFNFQGSKIHSITIDFFSD